MEWHAFEYIIRGIPDFRILTNISIFTLIPHRNHKIDRNASRQRTHSLTESSTLGTCHNMPRHRLNSHRNLEERCRANLQMERHGGQQFRKKQR